MLKPLLSSEDLIEHMENRGIKFEQMSKEKALSFLKYNNNYFKLSSYRKNFPKYTEGKKKELYIDLDFAYLVDLSTIDMHLRHILLKMTLDIEHYVKVNLLQHIESNQNEDGYQIVREFVEDSLAENGTSKIIRDIKKNAGNPYCGELLDKYRISESSKIEDFPVWAFIEVISFGTLRRFNNFYYKKNNIKDKYDIRFLLITVNQIRNAVAHNNCIINNLYPIHPKSIKKFNANDRVMEFLSEAKIKKSMRSTKMKNPRLKQIITMLYVFDKIVTSDAIKKSRYEELLSFVNGRMRKKEIFYKNNPTIMSTYKFVKKISMHLYIKCKKNNKKTIDII